MITSHFKHKAFFSLIRYNDQFLTSSVYLHSLRVHSYDALIGDLKTNQQKWKKVLLPSHCYNSPGASRAIYSAVRLLCVHAELHLGSR
jgi:hypothetical protein